MLGIIAVPSVTPTATATATTTATATSAQEDARLLDVIEVSGRIDPVLLDFITRSLNKAEKDGDEVLVLRIDSRGDLVSTNELDVLAFRLAHSSVPVAAWVGPTGARAYGGAFRLLEAANVAGMASGARIGRAVEGAGFGGRVRVTGSLGAQAARDREIVDSVNPTLGDFIVGLDGRTVGDRQLHTRRVVTREGVPRQVAAGQVRFAKLGLLERVLHSTSRPGVTYLLLVVGISLIVFEFFSAGIGVAGMTGAFSFVLACYGLAVLPTRPIGLALMALGVFGLAVDVQTGAPRAWTAIGVLGLSVGSWRLFDGEFALPWLTLVLVVAGTAFLMLTGMPAMLRSRFATPTIGRESMIGEMADATSDIDPEGTVRLHGGVWRARTNRATPISTGDPVRVVAIDGLLLEVEPEEGGARDAGH